MMTGDQEQCSIATSASERISEKLAHSPAGESKPHLAPLVRTVIQTSQSLSGTQILNDFQRKQDVDFDQTKFPPH
jgi:hypothetical protein